jgi:mannose-6-phosphate isomerase
MKACAAWKNSSPASKPRYKSSDLELMDLLQNSIPKPDPGSLHHEPHLEPFRIDPTFSPRLWGSRSLAPLYPEKSDLVEPIGEAWLTDVNCRVASGVLAGKTLGEAWREMPSGWRGESFAAPGNFPLLVKFIFPTEKLSIQVHPDDAYASLHEKAAGACGKTEMWHVVSAAPGASLLLGLRPGVTRESFVAALENHTLEGLLQRHAVQARDTFFVPARTPHTIGPDMVICEVQQYSDLTYRIYDYNRRDPSGKLRELHIEKALAVTNFDSAPVAKIPPRPWVKERPSFGVNHLVDCPYFSVDRLDLRSSAHFKLDARRAAFRLIVVLSGEGGVSWLSARGGAGAFEFQQGECWFIPAGAFASVTYRPKGEVSLIEAGVPDRADSSSARK